MKVNYKNKKSIEKMLKQGFAYSLFTVSNKDGFKKIAIKKSMFKDNYTIIYFNEDVNAIETKETKIEILEDNRLSIEGFGILILQEANIVLKNPVKDIERTTEIYRQIDRKARDEEIIKADKIKAQIIESKDTQIEQIKETAKKQEDYYTTGRIKRLKDIKNSVISTKIYHDSYDYKQVFTRPEGFHMQSSSEKYDYEEKRDLSFLLERLESIAEAYNCEAFSNNNIKLLISKLNEKFNKINGYDESAVNSIQSLYGLIADELTTRTYELCDFVRENNIDTTKITYSNLLYSGSSNYYEEESSWSDTEVIEDYYKTVMSSVAAFVEKVTGQDIRNEIEARLTKGQVMIPILIKTIQQ